MPGAFFVATSRPRWGYVGLYRRRWDCSPAFAPAPDTGPAWGSIQKLPQREKPPHAERLSRKGCASFQVPPLRVYVAAVAEQQPALVDEVSDGGDVAGAVHDGQLRSRQLLNPIQELLVPEIRWAV